MSCFEFLLLLPMLIILLATWPLLLLIIPFAYCVRKITKGIGFSKKTQKAAIYDFRAADNIRVTTNALVPELKAGHCIVKIHAAGVNPVDAKGIVGDKFPEGWMWFWFRMVSGQIVGFDFSGEIVNVGVNESDFKVGDEVFGLNYQFLPIGVGKFGGTLQEFALVPLHEIWQKPKSLTHVEAAALPLVGLTCLQAFEQHGIKQGDRLLVIGASGGVGHVATGIASRKGVNVTGICSTSKVEFVQKMGAAKVVDYRAKEPAIKQLQNLATKDGKFDMVFDTVSSADSRDKAANYESQIRSSEPPIIKVAHGSQAEEGVDKHNYVVFGGIFISWMRALIKRLSRKFCCCTCNFFPKGFELFWIDMPHGTRYLKDLQELCDNQGLRPKVSKVLPFDTEGCQAAFHALNPPKSEKRSTAGKIVIDMVQKPTQL